MKIKIKKIPTTQTTHSNNRNEFPEAAKYGNGTKNSDGKGIFASTYTDFVTSLTENSDVVNTLPVYDQEIGDTWVHGPASDPWKLAAFRVMQRQRSQCLDSNQCTLDSYPFYNFSRFLLKVELLDTTCLFMCSAVTINLIILAQNM